MASTITEFAHLQIPLEEIEKATNNFAKKNIIGSGGFGNVYRGKLMRSGEWIKFSARRLNRKYGQGDVEFLTEISTLSCLKHENLVSMIGFCDEKGEKIIVNKYYTNGSLLMHLSKPTLTWIRRMDIALGIARAIEYIHHKVGQSYYIIHRNINSSTILLDENLVPKLSGFEFSIKHPVNRRNEVFLSETIGTYGYIDPEIYKTGGVTHKSDIYSLGVVLSEILCGRKVNDDTPLATRNNGKMSLREIIDKEVLSDLIYKDYGSKLNWSSILYFSSMVNRCLLTDRSSRLDANDLVRELESASKALHNKNFEAVETETTSTVSEDVISLFYAKLETPLINPLAHIPVRRADENDNSQLTLREIRLRGEDQNGSSYTRKVNILEHLRIPLKDIQVATNNFSVESISMFTSLTLDRLRLRHSGICYTAQLECLDRDYMFSMEGKNILELPKRCYKVWLLRIRVGHDIFNKQIEILGRCKHPNIESLLGFCDEGCVRILVYEFTNQEPLHSRINSPDLTWERCLKICLNVARGLNYLHIENGDQKAVIHGNITIDKIDVDSNGGAKLVDFTYSVFVDTDQDDAALGCHVLPAVVYTDPEYLKSGKLTRESDVYSFGVVMYGIFCGSSLEGLMSNVSVDGHGEESFMQLIRWSFDYGMIKEQLASKFKEENSDNKYFLPKGPNKDSLDTFLEIMYMCLAKTQNQRPQMQVVLKELEKALSFQENHKDPFRMSFEDIKFATDNFSPSNKIGEGGFGMVFKGELAHKHGNGYYNIVVKLDKSRGQGEKLYYNELQILHEYMHENIIGLLGYSNETDVRLIVYEQASKGSLDRYLNDVRLTWRNRLKICVDVATGLDFIHGGIRGQSVVIHRDLKSANILLFDDWKAKIGDFGLSLITIINKETNFIIDHPCGTMCYVDPVYLNSGILTVESDIYSFGVLLFEILYGRETYKISKPKGESLLNYIKRNFEKGKQEEIVFKAIKKEIMPKSLTTFLDIVQSCLAHDREERPTSKEVLSQLKKALEFQNEKA